MAKRALGSHSRTSHASAISKPAPEHSPLMAQMTGPRTAASAEAGSGSTSSGSKLMPEQKSVPEALRSTSTAGSRASRTDAHSEASSRAAA